MNTFVVSADAALNMTADAQNDADPLAQEMFVNQAPSAFAVSLVSSKTNTAVVPPPHAAWFYGEHRGVQIQYSFVPTLFVAGYDPLFHDYSGDEVLDRVLDFIHPWARPHELNYNILDLALPSTLGWEKGLDLDSVNRLHEYAVASHSFEVKSTSHFTVTISLDSSTETDLSADTSVLLPRRDDEETQLKLMERVVGQMIEDSVELESPIVEMVDEEFWNLF